MATLRNLDSTLAACLMPDHLHWIVRDCSRLAALVRRFKSYSTRRAHELGFQGPLWQRSYWDHVIRTAEGLDAVVRYVLDNPVRAGLAERPGDWPWTIVPANHGQSGA